MHNNTIPYIIRFKIKHTKYSSHNERIYTKIVLTYMQQKEQNYNPQNEAFRKNKTKRSIS